MMRRALNFVSVASRPVLASSFRTSFARSTFVIPSRFIQTHEQNPTQMLDKKEVEERVLSVIKRYDKVEPAKVAASSVFATDLGLDSLDTVEIVMAMEDEFNIEIPDEEADKMASVPDVVSYISSVHWAK